MVTGSGWSKVDDWPVTESAVASEPGTVVTQPVPANTDISESATAVIPPIQMAGEPCSHCSAPLAHDQRYCLQCGSPRAHVSGPIAGTPPSGPESLAGPSSPQALSPGLLGAPFTGLPGTAFGSAQPPGRNNTLALLAGVGVLLLAMGIGVLIGRAGAGSAKVPPAQVISVGGSATGTSPTVTTPTSTTEAPASSSSAKKAAKAKSSSGSGSSITKPAPASAVQNLRSGAGGQSYEQKSKNLPNVVETG
jgi:hypothetical protein